MFRCRFSQVSRIVLFVPLVILAGCNANDYPLSEGEKASMVAELISSTEQCAVFKDKLALTGVDSAAIDAVYYEATKAGCVKKDI
jgi:hypothetical protein